MTNEDLISRIRNASALLYDLDDTLYPAFAYAKGACRFIANKIEKTGRLSIEEIYERLIGCYIDTNGREFLTKFVGQYFPDINKKDLVGLFNLYEPEPGELNLFPGVSRHLLEVKSAGKKTGIVTDGDKERQRRKIEAINVKDRRFKDIGIENFKNIFDEIVYAGKDGKRTSKKPFIEALEKLECEPGKVVYFGDNPEVDVLYPKEMGITTVIVRSSYYISDEYEPHFRINSFENIKLEE
ncbi:HAD family hydrolase [Candidatus Woesearchaeota archaeon]|nr:HAD family hydrolase [Candidatus Woesearchaeota archaeon]